jgi:hypothetical protein
MSIIKKVLCKIRGCPTSPPVVEVWTNRQGQVKTLFKCRECLKPVGAKRYE